MMNIRGVDRVLIPIWFATVVGLISFAVCNIWNYESNRTALFLDGSSWSSFFNFFRNPFEYKQVGFFEHVNHWWRYLSSGEQVFWPIFGLNLVVFIGWQINSWQLFMLRWFCHENFRGDSVALPMLLSTFSHASLVHFATNMSALHSLAPLAVSVLGREMFFAYYVTLGVVASIGSHFHMICTRSTYKSLGASGALLGMSALVYSRMPDMQVQFFFLPGVTFPASTAVFCLLMFDIFCLVTGKIYFDHAAHLTGFTFGLLLHKYGSTPISNFRSSIIMLWEMYRHS